MRTAAPSAALALALVGAPAFASPCVSTGSTAAATFPEIGSMSEAQVSVVVSAPLMLKLMKVDEAAVRRAGATCSRERFDVAGVGAYLLTGDDGERTFPRRAVPQGAAAPTVFLSPVSDIKAAMAQSKGGPAPPVSYVLAVAEKGAVRGFRLYDAVPDDARLKADVEEVLQGRRKPFFVLIRNGEFKLLVN